MTTQELRTYIDRVLGNGIRCLLPSYWWKRLFNLTIDKVDGIEEKVTDAVNRLDVLENDAKFIYAIVDSIDSAASELPDDQLAHNAEMYTYLKEQVVAEAYVKFPYDLGIYIRDEIWLGSLIISNEVHYPARLSYNRTLKSDGSDYDFTFILETDTKTYVLFEDGYVDVEEKEDTSITVDSQLSDTSENPVQNKVVYGQFLNLANEVAKELDEKVDKVSGKQLSTEDFTTALKTKLNGLSNYDDTAIQNAVNSLTNQINTLVSGDASTAIESFNEIIAFLNGVTDSENLDSIIASIEQQIAGKMDAVTLAKVATSGSYNDLNDKPTIPAAVTESTVSGWGFTKNTGTYSKPSAGIPKSDLASDVQASLGKADSAIQSIKTINGESIVGEGNIEINVDTSTLATKEELAEAEEVTAAALNELDDRIKEVAENSTANAATKEELESAITAINETIVENEEITAAALNDLDNRKANKEYVNDLVDRKADKEYVEDALANLDIDIDTSTLVTKDEFAEVEEVWATSYNQLIQKVTDVQQYIYNEAASRRQFDEAIAEIETIMAENESVITAAWNQLKTRIDALEAALRQGE